MSVDQPSDSGIYHALVNKFVVSFQDKILVLVKNREVPIILCLASANTEGQKPAERDRLPLVSDTLQFANTSLPHKQPGNSSLP